MASEELYITLEKEASASFVEKKSEFIGYACPCKTEQEALDFIAKIRKKHADAKHNVYAYQIKENNIARFTDDGEPQGTAVVALEGEAQVEIGKIQLFRRGDLASSTSLGRAALFRKQGEHISRASDGFRDGAGRNSS